MAVEVVMEVMVELAQVLGMILALVLAMVDQEAYMEVGQAIVAVVVIIHMPGRCSIKPFPRSCTQVSWLLHLVAQS